MAKVLDIKTASGKKSKKDKPDRLSIQSPVQSSGKGKHIKKVPIVDIAIAAKQSLENAKAEVSDFNSILIDAAKQSLEKSLNEGTFVKTVDISGSTAKIQIQFQDRYSALSDEMEEPLKEIFEEKFPIMFKINDSEVLKTEKQNELKKILGDRYDAFFESTRTVVPTKDFQYNYFIMKDSLNSDQKETVQKVLDACQSTPAVKYPK